MYLYIFIFAVAASLLQNTVGSDATFDVTESLYGSTIYIESLYYPGEWVGASDHYNGWLFALSEKSVFNPQKPCRLEVVNCYSGYACLRTRYREFETFSMKNSSSKMLEIIDKNITSAGDPQSYFLEAGYFDVDFSSSTASPSSKGDEFKWKIKCSNQYLQVCYIENKYYPGAQLYPHYDGSLDTAYRESGDHDSWFRHRIMNPKFSELDPMGELVFELCNSGDIEATPTVTFTQGITIEPTFSINFGMSISAEIKESAVIAEATQTVSGNWGIEFGITATWSEETTQSFQFVVEPKTKARLYRSKGQYGSAGLAPYHVGANQYRISTSPCSSEGQIGGLSLTNSSTANFF